MKSAVGVAMTLCGVLAAGPVASAQELWRGARAGMGVPAVKKLIPEAKAVPREANGGLTDTLRIASLDVVGFPAKAAFTFTSGKLSSVSLDITRDLSSGEQTTLLANLKAKYGEPASCNLLSCQWVKGGLNILLLRVTQPTIVYKSAMNENL